MREKQFRTKRGELTPYAFSCGYIERHGEITLQRYSGGVYGLSTAPEFWHLIEDTNTTILRDARATAKRVAREIRKIKK